MNQCLIPRSLIRPTPILNHDRDLLILPRRGDEPAAQPRDPPREPAVGRRVPLRQAGPARPALAHAHLPGQATRVQGTEEGDGGG